jgi:hypothetical protein
VSGIFAVGRRRRLATCRDDGKHSQSKQLTNHFRLLSTNG